MTSTKLRLRTDILTRRRALSPAERAAAAGQVVELMFECAGEVRCVAAYVPVGSEPGSLAVLDRFKEGGAEVLLPVVLDDGDLDWARYDGAAALAKGRGGVREPTGRRLGRDAIRDADVVFVPALAVDRAGHRLGRGGGAYDRALARVAPGVPVIAVLHDGELVDEVPVEPHDRPVTHVVTPKVGCRPVG